MGRHGQWTAWSLENRTEPNRTDSTLTATPTSQLDNDDDDDDDDDDKTEPIGLDILQWRQPKSRSQQVSRFAKYITKSCLPPRCIQQPPQTKVCESQREAAKRMYATDHERDQLTTTESALLEPSIYRQPRPTRSNSLAS